MYHIKLFKVSVFFGSVYWCCGSFGFISIIQVMGYEEGRRMIGESDPLLLVVGLPVIPITLILAKLIKWEDYILQLWKRKANQIPRPLSYLIESPPKKSRSSCDQILLDPGFNDPVGCTRMICGALLLPTVSALVGEIFFSRFSSSQWRRSLIGGFAFLLFKGAMKIYLRKSKYVLLSKRSIKNYVPSSSRTGMDGDNSGEDTDSQAASGSGINHMRAEPALEDNDEQFRGLTISMTIRT